MSRAVPCRTRTPYRLGTEMPRPLRAPLVRVIHVWPAATRWEGPVGRVAQGSDAKALSAYIRCVFFFSVRLGPISSNFAGPPLAGTAYDPALI